MATEKTKESETITENIFRNHYGTQTFIEKSAIPEKYGFKSKNETENGGFPDFFRDEDEAEFLIVVEAKAKNHNEAESDIRFYIDNNNITKDIIGIAVSGQTLESLKVSYFFKKFCDSKITKITTVINTLLSLDDLKKLFKKLKYGDSISTESLIAVLKDLNNQFHKDNKVRSTDRSLFFSGLMIALNSANFRNSYKSISAPSAEEISTTSATIPNAHNLNLAIIQAIDAQLKSKINNLSKEYSWKDKFSFIKNIDYPLFEYKAIIEKIEGKIFRPFKNEEKQDILGRAYKIFLSRAGKAESKNIILTPDHIKELMVKLARLTVDDVVLDTCTGSGGFLMESMETMIKLAYGDSEKIKDIKNKQLIGFEIDSVLFALACSNMFLHGDGQTNLLYRSSLLNGSEGSVVNSKDADILSYIKKLKPTKIIINPPYENNSSIAFIKQALNYLEPNGKLVIIVPNPTLTQNQGKMTDEILQMARLDFVIKMPANLFSEQKRTVNTSILGFTKTPHLKDDEVVFYHLDDDGFVSIQNKGRLDKNNKWREIEKGILDAVMNSKEVLDVCSKKRIFKDDQLNCAGFQPQKSKNPNYQFIKIKELFKIEEGELASNDGVDGGAYDFITAAEEWKKHDAYSHDTEALIYAVGAAGSLGRGHYAKGKFIASNLCLILTEKDATYPINYKFYALYFNAIRKRIVVDLAEGTSKLTISKVAFEEYYVDYIPKAMQDAFVKKNLEKLNKLKKQLVIESKKTETNLLKLL